MASKVIRMTLFKIPSKENQLKVVELYKTLSATATKDGKPYIVSLEAGPANEDARSQGFTFVAKSEFKNKEDFDYYDTECEAHKTLKVKAKQLVEGMMMVYYTPGVTAYL